MSDPLVVNEMLSNPSLNVLDNIKPTPIEPLQSCIILNFCRAQQQSQAADPDGNYAYSVVEDKPTDRETSINFARFSNLTIDAALEAGRTTSNPRLRIKAYQTVSDQFATYVPYI